MKLLSIYNPNHKNDPFTVSFNASADLQSIPPDSIDPKSMFTGVTNDAGEVIGGVRTERLIYLVRHLSELKLLQVFEHLTVGIIVVDADSRIYYVNPSYRNIIGVDTAKIIGRYLSQIESNASLLKVLESRKPLTIKKQLIQSMGKYVSTRMFPLYEQESFIGAYSIFTDITEINHLTSEVARISNVAEEYHRQIRLIDEKEARTAIGESRVFRRCISQAHLVASTDASVLIRGDNGTGKEVFSKIIQRNSARRKAPFIKVNCAAIPETLVESELFGYEEGSFTGARKGGKAGKFQLADGGTIFLDEIGDLPLPMQAKLLRTLQEGEIERVGASSPIPVDVRVIAATNKSLEEMIEEGTFRIDLYYRLNTVTINLPSLKERGNDVILLADHFLRSFNEKNGTQKRISEEVYLLLLKYDWPGNVRELYNTIESAAILGMGDVIMPDDLTGRIREKMLHGTSAPAPHEAAAPASPSDGSFTEEPAQTGSNTSYPLPVSGGLKNAIRIYEADLLLKTLRRYHGNHTEAMAYLQLPRRTYFRKLSEYGITKKSILEQ